MSEELGAECEELQPHMKLFKRLLTKDYGQVVEAVRNAGCPNALSVENDYCDGTKLEMGFEDKYRRVGRLMCDQRTELGDNPNPKELLMVGARGDVWVGADRRSSR